MEKNKNNLTQEFNYNEKRKEAPAHMIPNSDQIDYKS